MTSTNMAGSNASGPRFPLWAVVILSIPAFMLVCAYGVTSYFRLGSDAAALRHSLMGAVAGHWHNKIAVNVGGLTFGLVRAGSHLFPMPPEPRAAIDAVRGAQVGIYELEPAGSALNPLKIFSATDKAMRSRGWERAVGVANGRQLVAIYFPRKNLSFGNMKCCLAVLDDCKLVVVSARGNLEPLLDLVRDKVPELGKNLQFSRL